MNLQFTMYGECRKDFIMKKELNLPNYAVFDQIDFWIIAPDDSFKNEGIEQGDLVACYSDKEEFSDIDEARDIYLFHYQCQTRFMKRDTTGDDVIIYFDDRNENKITISWDEYQEKGCEVGKVVFVLKCKSKLYDRKSYLKQMNKI